MKALLICPAERIEVAAFAESTPLANLVIFGKSLVEHWLEHLVMAGAKEVFILASDRPEQVRTLVRDGARWGIRVEIFPETRELTTAEARAKYHVSQAKDDPGWLPVPQDVTLMDHLPGLSEFPLFTSSADWFKALTQWLPRAATTPDRIGIHEIKPGVWVGLHARISPEAELHAPCWIGENVSIGAGAIIGPEAVLENNSFIERGAEISRGVVGAETFVGELAELRDSLALGRTLVNWKLGSTVKVPENFLLGSLTRRESVFQSINFLGRLVAALTLLLTLPFALLLMLKLKFYGLPAMRPRIAVRPHLSGAVAVPGDTLVYYELAGASGWLRRWPQLWSIVRGDFAWVGNRPLNPNRATRLMNDFERLWLTAPLGLISLADAEGCTDCFKVQTRAHASFYATQANWRLDWSIFVHAIFLLLTGTPYSQAAGWLTRSFEPRIEIQEAR